MNNKLLALILILLGTIVNFNNCADKAAEEAQAMPFFGPGSLAELVKEFKEIKEYAEFKEIKEYAQKIKKMDPNFKQFKERVLNLFDKFNNEELKQKVGSVKHYREFLIQAGLYPKDKIDLEGQPAIKAFEDALEDEFYNILKGYFENMLTYSPFLRNHLAGVIQIMPIKIGNKKLELSDVHHKDSSDIDIIIGSNLSPEQAAQVLVAFFGEDLNKPVLEIASYYRSQKKIIKVPLLILLEWDYRIRLERLRNNHSSAPTAEELTKLANVIKVLLKLSEVDIAAKDSMGYDFAAYANQKDAKGAYVSPELHQIYEEHMAYIKQRRDALKEGLEDALPIEALRNLAAEYVN